MGGLKTRPFVFSLFKSETRLEVLTCEHYHWTVTVTITAKGQITIPLRLRQRFHLNVGDQLEFDESAPVLTARRVVDRSVWTAALGDWQAAAAESLRNHPWENLPSTSLIDDLRGGPMESQPPT